MPQGFPRRVVHHKRLGKHCLSLINDHKPFVFHNSSARVIFVFANIRDRTPFVITRENTVTFICPEITYVLYVVFPFKILFRCTICIVRAWFRFQKRPVNRRFVQADGSKPEYRSYGNHCVRNFPARF